MSTQAISETLWCLQYNISKSLCHHGKKAKALMISCLDYYEVGMLQVVTFAQFSPPTLC